MFFKIHQEGKPAQLNSDLPSVVRRRDEQMGWEKPGLRRDAVPSQVIDVLKAPEIKESVLLIG